MTGHAGGGLQAGGDVEGHRDTPLPKTWDPFALGRGASPAAHSRGSGPGGSAGLGGVWKDEEGPGPFSVLRLKMTEAGELPLNQECLGAQQ